MWKIFSDFRVSSFRSRLLVWIMLTAFVWSFLPSVSLAQQPTATISTVSGTVLVNGQKADKGTKLSAGSVIETQAGATVVLELSDGSLVELGENTKLDLAVLSQTATGGRISRIKLLWGRVRAKLSPGHQQADAVFEIETPNAAIGVKFSQPDVEVSYDPEKQETIGMAHTVELIATNLLSGEKKVIPVGSSVIIMGMTIKVVVGTTAAAIAAGTTTAGTAAAGTAAAGAATTGTTTAGAATTGAATAGAATAAAATGVSAATVAAVGAGAVAVGGVAVVAATSGDGDGSSVSFTGTYTSSGQDNRIVTLTQNGTSVTGTWTTVSVCTCCTVSCNQSANGTVDATSGVLTAALTPSCPLQTCVCPDGSERICQWGWPAVTFTAILVDNGRILRVTILADGTQTDLIRQ